MASTLISSLINQVRTPLKEPTPDYWSDGEILLHLNNGAKILWRAIVDLYEHHFNTLDDEHFFIQPETGIVWGVPEDVARIVMIEPRVLGANSSTRGLIFEPADWTSDKFIMARARGPVSPSNVTIYYTLMDPGAPVGPPIIRIAPRLSTGVLLSVTYVHTLPPFDEDDRNPIPGESDQALINYAVAQCRAKEREDSMPDPGWMALFATERTDILERIAIRQIQQPDVVMGMFEGEEG